jgi:hypothetical protein
MKNRRAAGQANPDREQAQMAAAELAVAALTFIAGEPEKLGRFLALSGIGPESIREAARAPGFLLGVLDYIAGDETLLLAFAEHSGVDPSDIESAQRVLAGGAP